VTDTRKRNSLIDDIAEGIRRVLEDLDGLINPEKQQERARVPIPIPVRRDKRDPRDPRNYR